MEKIVVVVTTGKATVSQGRRDDDFADRLNSRYTPLILIVCTIFVTIQQVVRNPITCWAPVHFTDGHEKYANNYCWIRNTYYLPYEDQIPRPHEDRQMLRYYQWIQFVLLGQAVFFFLPTLIWRTFNSKAGVDADNIMKTAHEIPVVDNADKKEEKVRYLAGLIDRFLESRKPEQGCHCDLEHFLSGVLCRCCGRRMGNFLVLLYVFQKLLFLLNLVLQFVVLSKIFGQNFFIYGPETIKEPSDNHYWYASGYVAFPRVTMCDFQVRRLGNVHRYTLQCVLPLNLYIEKLYMFQWFWLIFVMFVSVCGFIMWSVRFISRTDRLNFIKNHLYRARAIQPDDEDDLEDVEEFLDDYLRQDGAFLLRLMAGNTNPVSSAYIIAGVWDFWREKRDKGRKKKFDDDDDDLGSIKSLKDTDDTSPLMATAKPPTLLETSPGLKQRKPPTAPSEDGDNRKPVSRAPTLYVRGSDTLNNQNKRPSSDLYPTVSMKGSPEASTDPSDSSDDDHSKWSPKTEPSAPASSGSDGMTPLISSDDGSPVSGGESPRSEPPEHDPESSSGPGPVPKPRKSSTPQLEAPKAPMETTFD